MKKKIMTIAVAVLMLFVTALTVSANNAEIGFDSSYNAETGLVTVSVYIDNAQGLQSADLSLAFDTQMYEYKDFETEDIADGMIVAGLAEGTPGLCSCSIIFTEKCVDSDLDANGRLNLATYTFSPVDEEYDLNEFCFWASSFDVNDASVVKTIKAKGNELLKEDRTDMIVLPTEDNAANNETTTKKVTQSIFAQADSKWYVYLIAGVLVIGAIAGIAFIAMKNSNNESEKDSDNASENGEN